MKSIGLIVGCVLVVGLAAVFLGGIMQLNHDAPKPGGDASKEDEYE